MNATPRAGHVRVLVADGNRTYRDVLFRLLTSDFDVEVAADSHEALQRLGTGTVDIAIIDAFMSPQDAPQLAAEVARRSPDTICILAGAYVDSLDEHPWSEGFDLLLPKPFDLAGLEDLMERATRLHTERRELSTPESRT